MSEFGQLHSLISEPFQFSQGHDAREEEGAPEPAAERFASSKPGHLEQGSQKLAINGRFVGQPTTGVQRVARELVIALDDLLIEGSLAADITLLVPFGHDTQNLGLKRISVKECGPFKGQLWEQLVLPRTVGNQPLLCLCNSAPLLSLLGKTAVSTVIHDLSFLDFPFAYKPAYRLFHRLILPRVIANSENIILVSETERARLAKVSANAAERSIVAQNGGWHSQVRPSRQADAELELPKNFGLYVGSMSRRKNFERVIESAIELARTDGMPFVFVGEVGQILRKPAFKIPSDVEHLLHFVGQIEDVRELARLYCRASVLVLPSLYEASPLPPIEAAHFACPAVVSNIPSMWERCGDGAAYCNPYSTGSIVAAVRKIVSDETFREEIISRSTVRASEFDWYDQAKTIAEATLDICLGNNPNMSNSSSGTSPSRLS